jgi:hypothetical protein
MRCFTGASAEGEAGCCKNSPLFAQILAQHTASVDVIMAVRAEVLPVAAIRGVVVVIAVAMMDRQEVGS